MPTYNYSCEKNHTYTEFRFIDHRDLTSKCDKCGSKVVRTPSMPSVHTFSGDSFAREHEIEGNGVRSYG